MLAYQNQRLYPSMPVAGFDKRVYCEGGSTAVRNGMRYHVFTSSGTLTVIRGGVVYAMVVAAGGSPRSHASIIANGANGGGGGGGGGLLNYLPVIVPEGSYQTVIIGTSTLKSRGGSSSITCLRPATATGGGTSGNNQLDGLENGGSGGGQNFQAGEYGGLIGQGNTPPTIPSQGNNGGLGQNDGAYASQAGGGGGFATAAGGGLQADYGLARAVTPSEGGLGLALDADTVSLGALINNNTHFSSGGGGAGNISSGNSQGRGGTGAGNGAYAGDATSATMYGCGGGGGADSTGGSTRGYQGIIIIRYPIN